MGFIAESDRDELRLLFERELKSVVRVRLTIHVDACEACEQAESVLEEITALSNRMDLDVGRGHGELPEIRLVGAARGAVRFIGLPSGYEFPGLIDAIMDVSRGETSLSPETVGNLSVLNRRVHLQVFTTPT